MGIIPSFPKPSLPVKHDIFFFESPANFTSLGVRRAEQLAPLHTTLFHKLHAPFWEELVNERKIDLEARKKFYDMGKETILSFTSKFPRFEAGDIEELRFQFQCFDLNSDGLIDKTELMHVLDDMGDKSDPERREMCFREVDEDGSGAIDFEEFLGLIYRLKFGPPKSEEMNTIAVMSKRGNDAVKLLRKFSIVEQLENGLF